MALADKVHNARAILADFRTIGDQVWHRFNPAKSDVLWYYRALADAFSEVDATRSQEN